MEGSWCLSTGCALLKKGSSKVRTFPNSSGRHKLLLFPPSPLSPSSFLFLSPLLPPLLTFLPSSFSPPHIPLPFTPCSPILLHLSVLLSCSHSLSSPSFLLPSSLFLLSFLPSLLLSSHGVQYLLWISLDQFETNISEYQSSMTFPPAHYGSARAYIQLHR